MTGPHAHDVVPSSTKSSSSSSSSMIHHSGRAHIRGKIRRVWRPRFLQLADNGLVRYYELEQSEATTQPEKQQPKSTLLIYHARIIDVTTFRDMHVGLPKGTFGFCFHARRLFHMVEQQHFQSECHPPERHVAPRDFLCAVATLEEAQSWVVALQWAASLNEAQQLQHSGLLWDTVTDYQEYNNYSDDEDYYSAATAIVSQEKGSRKNALQVVESIGSSRSRASLVKTTTRAPVPQKLGKIVVTKVRRYRFVRVGGKLDVAYDIQLLLLRTTPKRSPWIVEERTVARTRKDLQNLLQRLRNEQLDRNDVLEQAQQLIDQLSNALTSHKNTQKSVTLVDSAMRTLAMEGAICNSKAMRSFWCITPDAQMVVAAAASPLLWPPRHDPEAFLERKSLTPTTKNPDDFVKQWLQEPPLSQQDLIIDKLQWYLVWMLKRPAVLVPVVAVSCVLVVPLWKLYQSIMGLVISVRLDVLVVSWMASVGVGRTWEKRRRAALLAPKITQTASAPPKLPQPARPEPSQFEEEASLLLEEEEEEEGDLVDFEQSTTTDEEDDDEDYTLESSSVKEVSKLSSPLPQHPANGGVSCWSKPKPSIFRVRGETYLIDRVKVPSAPEPFVCRGVDVWLTDNPERHIARHPSVMGGKLGEEDSFVVNFLLPFGNFVACFAIPPLDQFPPNLREVWTKFLQGDQQYRDARLKLLPVVVDGPWIVRKAVGPGTSPALLGKVIPLQYYFNGPTDTKKGIYEVDIIITASRIAKGILSVVKGHTNMLTIAFAFIIEAAEEVELPETVLCTFQMHSLHLEDCPQLPDCNLDELQ